MEKHGVPESKRVQRLAHLSNKFEAAMITILPWTFMLVSFLSAVSLTKGWNYEVQVWLGAFTVANTIAIWVLLKRVEKIDEEYNKRNREQEAMIKAQMSINNYSNLRDGYENSLFESFIDTQSDETKPKYFKCPLMPFLPCCGIYCNFLLCTAGCGYMEWVIFMLFELFGVIFYLSYKRYNGRV